MHICAWTPLQVLSRINGVPLPRWGSTCRKGPLGMKIGLVVVKGRPEGMEIPLPVPQFLIGRDPRCNLRPNSESISKLHCAILHKKDGVYVRDLKSTNGTFINNDRIFGEIKVKDGDLLHLGPLVLAFKIEEGSMVTGPATPGSDDDKAVSWLLDYSAGTGSADP